MARHSIFILGLALCAVTATAQRPLVSGLDPATFDASVRPQDDLFAYVNNRWVTSTPMPPERVTYGTLVELSDRAELAVRDIVDEIRRQPDRKPGSEAQQIADLYASMMDEETIEQLGAKPIEPELRKIDAIATIKAFSAEAGYLSSIGAGGPFDGSVGEDTTEPGALVFQLVQGGTLLADRDYYLREDATTIELRRRYIEYLTKTFTLAGRSNAAEAAQSVLAFETELARAQLPRTDIRDTQQPSNHFQLSDLPKAMPGFDWSAWAKPQGLDRVKYVIVSQPSFFKTFATLARTTPLDTLKAWLAMRYITVMSSSLTKEFNDVRFEFFGRMLVGQEVQRARWRRAVGIASAFLPDAIGRRYVQLHFPPSARVRAEQLVDNIVTAYKRSLDKLDWMSGSARREALGKLAMLKTRVGYPDNWRSYRGLVVKPGDLVGNLQRYRVFDNAYRMGRLASGEDRGNWLIGVQVVNAYYQPVSNEMVLPAAILQPPLFDPAADDAVNYGGMGAMIAHEIGHGFDVHGRLYDASGRQRDWWTADDVRQFTAKARALVEQFNGYAPLPSMTINGSLTLDENLGDLGGLSIAYRAYQISLGGKPAPVIDGLTGDQRFFLGWARAWRMKSSEGYVRQMLLLDSHAPAEYRTNGPVGHLQAFYDAFGVKPGDKLYREPARRVAIW